MPSSPAPAVTPSLRRRLRYRFDTTMSRGAIALVAYLGLAALVLVVIGASLFALLAGGDASFPTRLWEALGRAMDSGTFTGDSGWGYRAISLLITLAGIFLVSALIGLIATALDQRIAELRKGRSPVLERGHSLILGWSESLPVILSELVIANENQRDACVVVMARKDKVEMEDELRGRIPRGASTRLVCRTGNPADPDELALVDPLAAKSVIVLSEPEGGGDAQAVKVALSLMTFDPQLERIPVTVELADARHAAALDVASAGRARTVVTSDLIARVTAQICYQSGLSLVVQELLDFDGDELYFREEAALVGRTYLDAQLAYADATVIGLRRADGSVELNPPPAAPIAAGDRLVAIAADDDAFTLAPTTAATAVADAPVRVPEAPLRALVVGWNGLGTSMLAELDGLVAPGSTLHVVADDALVELESCAAAIGGLANLAVTVEAADSADDEVVARIVGAADYDRIVLLCYREALALEEADARTLLTLLLVRRAIDAPGHRNGAASVVTSSSTCGPSSSRASRTRTTSSCRSASPASRSRSSRRTRSSTPSSTSCSAPTAATSGSYRPRPTSPRAAASRTRSPRPPCTGRPRSASASSAARTGASP